MTKGKTKNKIIVTRKTKGVGQMENGIAELNEVKEISAVLTRENKKYVVAVANALLFSQGSQERHCCQSGSGIKSQECIVSNCEQ